MQHHSVEQKNRLHRTFIGALDLLDTLGREPDHWEEECLSYALGAMACDLYSVAEVELEAFARPIGQRDPREVRDLESRPRRFTRDMLRHGLAHVLNKAMQPADGHDMPAAVAAAQIGLPLSSSSSKFRSAT